jgi:hypothetical protein
VWTWTDLPEVDEGRIAVGMMGRGGCEGVDGLDGHAIVGDLTRGPLNPSEAPLNHSEAQIVDLNKSITHHMVGQYSPWWGSTHPGDAMQLVKNIGMSIVQADVSPGHVPLQYSPKDVLQSG